MSHKHVDQAYGTTLKMFLGILFLAAILWPMTRAGSLTLIGIAVFVGFCLKCVADGTAEAAESGTATPYPKYGDHRK